MAGIVGYGAYVPYHRIQRSSLGGGRGERAVASFDEDATTMAVQACRQALGAVREADDLIFATTSGPYLEKLNAAAIQAACRLPSSMRSIDIGASSRMGLGALSLAYDLACSGRRVVAVAADVVTGQPLSPLEKSGGDAAAAFVVSNDASAPVRIVARASTTTEILDVYRANGSRFPAKWEERFGRDVLGPVVLEVMTRVLSETKLQVADLSQVVLDGSDPGLFSVALGKLGIKAEQIASDLGNVVGRAGVAGAGLALARVLDSANVGDRILVVTAADGAEAMVLEVGEGIDRARPDLSVQSWISLGRNDLDYPTYQKWRGLIDYYTPRRPDPDRPAAPPIQRNEKWKFGLVGERCEACGAKQAPPDGVCTQCGSSDQMVAEPFAEVSASVATFSVDHLTYSLNPPAVFAVLDFDGGGRMSCELTDVDPSEVSVGMRVEMTFRRLYTSGGVHNYFWKARPLRDA